VIWWMVFAQTHAATQVSNWDPEIHAASFSSSGAPIIWECGQVASGPMGGFSGNNACATRLSSNYSNNASSFLVLPDEDLTALSAPMLRWMQWYAIETGDGAQIEIFRNGEWENAQPVYGYPSQSGVFHGLSTDWASVQLDLTDVENLSHVRLRFDSDGSVNDDGWYVDDFSVWDGDIAPPRIANLTVLEDTEELDGPYLVTVEVEDNTQSPDVDLFFTVDGGVSLDVPMVEIESGEFLGEIPGQGHDRVVQYWVEAQDGFNVSSAPDLGSHSFRVRLLPPTDLTGPAGVVRGTEAPLTWVAPDSIHPVLGYRVYRGEDLVVETEFTASDVPLLGEGRDLFSVRAVYEVGEGDATDVLVLDTAVPTVLSLTPHAAYQGDIIRTIMQSENMLLVDGDVSVTFGEGVSVNTVEVRDVDTAVIRIEVDGAAEPGFRTMEVESGGLSVVLEDALTIVDGELRPKVERVEPAVGRQGLNIELEIWTSEPIETVESVDLGEGVYVQAVEHLQARCLRVTGWVDLKAPLGERMVLVDDGSRIWTGQSFKVLDQAPPTVGCAASRSHSRSSGRSSWYLLLPLLFVGLRRR